MKDVDEGDALETREWLDSLEALKARRGEERATDIVDAVLDAARRDWLYVPKSLTTPYRNTIPVDEQPSLPGDQALERTLRSIIRWNALAIILRANKSSSELGGPIGTEDGVALSPRLHVFADLIGVVPDVVARCDDRTVVTGEL